MRGTRKEKAGARTGFLISGAEGLLREQPLWEGLNKSILDFSDHAKRKAWFPLRFVINGLQPSITAALVGGLNQSIPDCSDHAKRKAWFSLRFVINGLQPSITAAHPCAAGVCRRVPRGALNLSELP